MQLTVVVTTNAKLLLAIRTILVSTRAGAITHERRGNLVLARETVERGAALLEQLGRDLPTTPAEVRARYEDARRELAALVERLRHADERPPE